MNYVVFAAGGGNDVFSAMCYIKHSLPNCNTGLVSLLGLTPFHYPHATESGIEPMSIVPTSAMSRYIQTDPPKKICCLERHIPQLSPTNKYVCLSPKYSIQEQTQEMNRIIESWDMIASNTKLIVVDFGGDVLSDGTEDSIISPELDAYTVALVTSLTTHYGYNSELCVCFPGIDGELTAERLKHYLRVSVKEPINKELWLREINKVLNVIGHERQGNTLPAMKRVLEGENTFTLSKSWIVDGKKRYYTKEIELDRDLQLHIHHCKLPDTKYKKLFTDPYDLKSMLDRLVSIYSEQAITPDRVQSSDLFLQYLVKDSKGDWSSKEMPECDRMLVTVCPACLFTQ